MQPKLQRPPTRPSDITLDGPASRRDVRYDRTATSVQKSLNRTKLLSDFTSGLKQNSPVQELLAHATLTDERIVAPSMELNVRLHASDGDSLSDPTSYRNLVGSLVYLVVSHPDIFYPVHSLSQFAPAPTSVHYSTFFMFYDVFVAQSLTAFSFPLQFVTPSLLFGCYVC